MTSAPLSRKVYENREPINKLSFVGGLTIRPLLVLFMLVFVSSTVSLSELVWVVWKVMILWKLTFLLELFALSLVSLLRV